MSARIAVCGGVLLALSLTTPLGAQVRLSERGTVSQTVDGTTITVDYARPQIRERKDVFGEKGKAIVYWGEVWTPGANWATTFQFAKDVRINGTAVPAGTYSVWYVPAKRGPWTVHLNQNPRLFHTKPPKAEEQFVTLQVPVHRVDRQDVLTFDFPEVGRDSATLRLRWGRVSLELGIAVPPTQLATLPPDVMAQYLGSYTIKFEGDTTEQQMEVIDANGAMRAIVDAKEPWTMALIPNGEEHHFTPAFMEKGQIVDVENVGELIFEFAEGRVTGFRAVDLSANEVWFRGTRKS